MSQSCSENEITAFAVVDLHAYHILLKKIARHVRKIKYQKCLSFDHGDESIMRIVATADDPIDPVAFDARRGPYAYTYDVKRTSSNCTRHAIPVWMSDTMYFINSTSKTSTETPLDEASVAAAPVPDELSGKYRKEFIVDRIVIYDRETDGNRHRMSLEKKCKFSGNGAFRQPDVPVYILSYEVEYPDASYIHDAHTVRTVCRDFVKMCMRRLRHNPGDMYAMIRSGQNNCLPESDLFISILNTYTRKFALHRPPAEFRQPVDMFLCKKWDGIRAMGYWKGDELLLYSGEFGFKHFTVPRVFSPDTIVQVEFFQETQTFVVTEVFAIINIEMDTDFVYFTRKVGNACRVGEGLYNGSNTSIQIQDNRAYLLRNVDPLDSIVCIQTLNTHYPKMFTKHYRLTRWPIDERHVLQCEKFTGQSDGVLLKTFDRSSPPGRRSPPTYYKIKSAPTVELLYVVRNRNFTSMEGTVYDDRIETGDEFHFKYMIGKYKRDIVVEFLVRETRLRYKCVRNDKMCPDGDRKIEQLIIDNLSK